jgi:alcohol dehydrogenase class IV
MADSAPPLPDRYAEMKDSYGLPPAITAYTGLDALTQLIEPYVSSRTSPLVDAICVEGIRRVAGALHHAYHDGADRDARHEMALGSLFGGLALANAGLSVVHGFAAPLGVNGRHRTGALCAALLPHGMEANMAALRARVPQHPSLERYAEIARLTSDMTPSEAQMRPELN